MTTEQKEAELEIVYFQGILGRAEATRICLTIGGVNYKDTNVDFATYGGTIKNKEGASPWNSLPFIKFNDGSFLGQSRAIARYAAKRAGLYPEDAAQACKVDSIMDYCEDLQSVLGKASHKTAENPAAAWKAAWSREGEMGPMAKAMDILEKNLARYGTYNADGDSFSVGNSMTVADIQVHCWSGFWLGPYQGTNLALDVLDDYKHINAVRKMVANNKIVKARYDKMGFADKPERKGHYNPC